MCARHVRPRPDLRGLLALTLLNPATIAYFAALVAGGAAGQATLAARAAFALGAFAASASWQLFLIAVGTVMVARLPPSARMWTGVAGNLVIAGLAIAILVRG